MDGAGDALLARAGFPGDQHGHVDASRLADDVADLAHPRALPELDLPVDRRWRRPLDLPSCTLRGGQDVGNGPVEVAIRYWRVEECIDGEQRRIWFVAAVRPVAEADDRARVAALELQALDQLRGVVAIQIEIEEREAKTAMGERFECFPEGGCEDGGVASHAKKGEEMVLHLCPAFDNENALIVHAVRPSGLRAACPWRNPHATPGAATKSMHM